MSTEQMTNSLPLLEQDKDKVFTTDLLPENLLEIIEELENKLNWNRDFCLLALLVVASGAIGSARISFIAGYEVKPILFGCLVGGASH